MFQPGRPNGRVLLTSLRPCARLSANSAAQQLRWRSWGDRSRNVAHTGDFEAATPLAEKLKDTGVFLSQGTRRAKIAKKRREDAKLKEEPEKKPEVKKMVRPRKKPEEKQEQEEGKPQAKKKGRPKKIVEPEEEKSEETPKRRGRPKKKVEEPEEETPSGDGTRVNIVDEKLVNDVMSYIKPSLERHKGCDLISIYPGAGLFTKALHDAVEPRSHLLLEPDEALYRPFLKPILQHKNTKLIPKSGIVWQDLSEVLTPANLPDQVEFDRKNLKEDPPRNDTLLINMNLAMHPKRKYMLFESMSRMVIYQLLSSLRTSTLFQKYGQVRMLVWIPDDEKLGILPRTIQHRKKMAIEGELVTEYIGEVCGADSPVDEEGDVVMSRRTRLRPKQFDMESMRQTILRMQKGGYVTPKGRMSRTMEQFLKSGHPLDQPVPLTEEKAIIEKSFHKELETLREQYESGQFSTKSPKYTRYRVLRAYDIWLEKRATRLLEFTRKYDAVVEAYDKALQAKSGGSKKTADKLLAKAKELNEAYNRDCDALPDYMAAQVLLMQDQVQSLRQPAKLGPLMSWDRRPYEPLPVKATDFFPNLACSLLDIQPKAMHRGLRAVGPGTDNAGDIFDMLLGVVLQSVRDPIPKLLGQVWPGTAEGIIPQCNRLTDPEEGGSPLFGHGAVGSRAANGPQLTQLLDEFMKWPFRPSYAELVGRLADERLIDESTVMSDGDGAGALIGNNTMDAF